MQKQGEEGEMTLRKQLAAIGACPEAVKWVGRKGLKRAWTTCERADWMLWYAARVADRKLVVRAACACAKGRA